MRRKTMLEMHRIDIDEIEKFLVFLREIAEWMNKNDKKMWDIRKLDRDEFLKSNKNSEFYLGFDNGVPVTSIMLKENDTFMWPDIEENETLIIGKLGVERKSSGKGLAIEMLSFAYDEASKRGKKYLRLDCYADREYLCKLYEEFGFKLIKKREMMPGLFAAFYELRVQ